MQKLRLATPGNVFCNFKRHYPMDPRQRTNVAWQTICEVSKAHVPACSFLYVLSAIEANVCDVRSRCVGLEESTVLADASTKVQHRHRAPDEGMMY